MYHPDYVKLPRDVYIHCVTTARRYHLLREREGQLNTALSETRSTLSKPESFRHYQIRNAASEKIFAIEAALAESADNAQQRKVIEMNLFDGIAFKCIPVDVSMCTMKRIRKRFIYQLAYQLNEI